MENKRSVCTRCLRPQRTCICQWIVPTAHATEVLFLQHPLEAGNAKNSAGLLHLSLQHSQLAIGETFGEEMLRALLHAPFPVEDAAAPHDDVIHPILLYPADADDDGAAHPQNELLHLAARHRLVVLDAT
jgi:DTW domain-containing protein YfiP